MPSFSEYWEEKTAYERRNWKEDCIFCSRAGNCGSEISEFCPLVDEED
jgi:hypothetical protein